MRRELSARFALPLLALALPFLSRSVAQDNTGEDPKVAVQKIVERASTTDVKELWPLANDLTSLGKDKVKAADAMRLSLKDAGAKGTLVLGRALLQIDQKFYSKDVAKALLRIVETNKDESQPAARLLGSEGVTLDRAEEGEILKKLKDLVAGGGLAPRTRIAAAQALWSLGASDERRVALKELKGFLKSEDPELQIEGALALASCDDTEEVATYLRKIQNEPTEQGQLAKLYLKREDEARAARATIDKLQKLDDDPDKTIKSKATGTEQLDPGDPRLLEDIIKLIQAQHVQGDQWSREDLVAAAARGMLNEVDPHSTFFTPTEYKKMFQELNQEYAGIGAQVRTINGVFTIARPFFSGPAYRSKIRAGDQILGIITDTDGKRGEWSTEGQPEDEVIKRLKGRPGSDVTLKVMRRGWVEPQEIKVTRELIQIPLLESEMLPGGIGYFEVLQFGRDATQQLVTELKDMLKTGKLKGVILDLRGNPGGFLAAAKDMCQVFLPSKSLVCYTKGRVTGRRDEKTQGDPILPKDIPVVVLVNEYSASASEITAGALQDHERATIVGEHTYGKGSVQRVFELDSLKDEPYDDADGNNLHDDWEKFTDVNGNGKYDGMRRVKLTVEGYYLPGGRNINTEWDREHRKVKRGGIEPDVVVPWPTPDLGKAQEIERVTTVPKKTSGETFGKEDPFSNYVRESYAKNPELFQKLAVNDGKDWNQYPGFDEFYQSLKTSLDRNDIRKILRLRIRDRVAEERGKMFPGYLYMGDVDEDPQLREAIALLLKKNGVAFESLPEYKALLDREKTIGVDLGPKGEIAKKTTKPNDEEKEK
jgi:carboxyl-terminal processing protease